MRRTLVILTLAVLAAGCIVKRTSHTLFLESDGSVTWTVHEQDVRSDHQDPAGRSEEEQGFLDALAAGEHPPALALRDLGGGETFTSVLRDRRPFEVRTTARFPSLEELARALLDRLGVPGTVVLAVDDAVWTLRVELRIDEIADGDSWERGPTALIENAEAYRLVASSARFVEAHGFAIEDDGRSVRFDLPTEEEVAAQGGLLELSLSWEEGM